jgi:chemotaxis protein MotB
MSATRTRRRGHAATHESDERWLLTYADMITLLMALFMVLFSISSVNISKYQTLQEALKAAFSGSVLPGGSAIQDAGNTPSSSQTPATAQPQAIVPSSPAIGVNGGSAAQKAAMAAQVEQSNFVELQHLITAYAAAHGLAKDVKATIDARGVQIRILSDHVLFASGMATLRPKAAPLLRDIANLLRAVVAKNPIVVEGYTDNLPQSSVAIPSNWYLSTDRADAVLRFLLSSGVAAKHLSAAGFASLHPIASNATADGRAQNRRVVIGVTRTPAGGGIHISQTTTAVIPTATPAG